MASVYKEGKGWTVAWMDSTGKRRYARGLPAEQFARMIAKEQENNKQAAKFGLIKRGDERLANEDVRTIEQHLTDFCRSLRGKGNTPQYVRETKALVHRIFKPAGIRKLSQINRHAIVRECDALMDRDAGNSRRTRNKALAASKAFVSWLFVHDRIPADLLHKAPMLDAEQDRRRVRKTMDGDEMLRLVTTTAGQPERGGMSGMDRMVRYALGLATGFRQGTLFSLKPGDFHLDDPEGAFIRVIATNTKGRKAYDQPLTADVVEMLRPWLAGKPATRPVFTKLPGAKPILAYRHDLKAAGIQYHADGTVEFCDQHAQRNAFITNVIRAAGLKVAQDLAHHSTPELTSKYGRLGMSDYRKALDAMPKLTPDKKADQQKNVG
jgi:site-specific recombinase XerC